jgi:hypothetical protein
VKLPAEDPPSSALYAIRSNYDWLRTWRYVIVRPAVKNVGFAAATFSNRRGHRVFPGIKRLMAITGYARPTVVDGLAVMRWLGFLYRVTATAGLGSSDSDVYQLCVPRTLAHVPMVDVKSGKPPRFGDLPPIAQTSARVLGVVERLGKGESTDLTPQSTELTGGVNSATWWELTELTPTTHTTNTTNKTSDHSARHERPDSGESGRKYDFDNDDDCYDYVLDHLDGYLDPAEASTVDGMLSNGRNPKAIVNSIASARGW